MQDSNDSRVKSTSPQEDVSTMHHIGFVVLCISAVIESCCRSVGGAGYSQTWHDPLQGARMAFIYPGALGSPSIELVEPVGEKSPVRSFLLDGGGLHHVCYEVPDIRAELVLAATRGLTVIRRPQPAAAFGGRMIAWVWSKENLLIEYLERGVAGLRPPL